MSVTKDYDTLVSVAVKKNPLGFVDILQAEATKAEKDDFTSRNVAPLLREAACIIANFMLTNEEWHKAYKTEGVNEASDLIPLRQVLEDMYDPEGGVGAIGARSYYYTHYATEEERKAMDRKDKIETVLVIIFMIAFWVAIGFAVVLSLINK